MDGVEACCTLALVATRGRINLLHTHVSAVRAVNPAGSTPVMAFWASDRNLYKGTTTKQLQ